MTLPTGWKQVPLNEVCRVVEGQVDPQNPEYRDLPHINGEVIESGSGRLLKLRTAAEDGLISGKYLFEPGMVLYSKLRPYLRKVTIAPSRGVCSADMYPLIFDPQRVDAQFAMFSLLAEPFTQYAIEESRRARMPKLNRAQLMAFEMPLPQSVEVQRRIASDLAEQLAVADAATCAADERLTAAAALPSAFLREAFESEEFRRSASTVNLGSLVDSYDEMRVPVRSHDRKPGPYPYYGASGVIDSVDRFVFDGEYLLIAEDGANLVARATPIAFVAKGRFWVNNHAHVVKPKDDRLLTYLVHYLAWLDISKYVSGSAQPKLSQAALNALPVLVPTSDAAVGVAERLSERVETANALVARCRQELASVQSLPGTMLRNVFGEAS